MNTKSGAATRAIRFALLAFAAVTTSLCLAMSAHADDTPCNLRVTDEVRTQLLQAGASLKGLPASDFTGLAPGKTYYAYDPDTATTGQERIWCLTPTPTKLKFPTRTLAATYSSNSPEQGRGLRSTTALLGPRVVQHHYRRRSSRCGHGTPSIADQYRIPNRSHWSRSRLDPGGPRQRR